MSGGLAGFDREPQREVGLERGAEVSLPKNRCEGCGYWFVTEGDETTCPDCLEGAKLNSPEVLR